MKTGAFEGQEKNRIHSHPSFVEIILDTKESPAYLRRLAVT